jgi:hypothetical protein
MKKQKIIFLDMDGVTLPDISLITKKNQNILETLSVKLSEAKDGQEQLSVKKEYMRKVELSKSVISLLNRACEITGAKIVLHTYWRRRLDPKEIKEKLIKSGLKRSFFHKDYSCSMKMTSEKIHDIYSWLNNNRTRQSKYTFSDRVNYYEINNDKTLSEEDIQNKMEEVRLINKKVSKDISDYGIDFVVIDDDYIGDLRDENGILVQTNKEVGFSIEDYRLVLGYFGCDDLKFGCISLEEKEIDLVRDYFFNNLDMYDYLFKFNKNNQYNSNASFISKKEAKRINDYQKDNLYNILLGVDDTPEEDDIFYQKRVDKKIKKLKVTHRKESLHPHIIHSDFDINRIHGEGVVDLGDFEKLPKETPFILTSTSPLKYMYAPNNVEDKESYLYGYLMAMEQK